MTEFDLTRFLVAQDPLYQTVCTELAAGAKRTHWMWFIFPQIAGLGSSPTARFYAIASRREAAAYAVHPVLGARLLECTRLVNAVEGKSAHGIFGSPDDMKFRSCMTLFANITPEQTLFEDAIAKYYAGEPDAATIARL